MTINRFCASGLQSIALAAERIRGGGAEVIVAGGTESMSLVPMGGNKISINPWLMEHYPDSYLSMGLTAERVAQHYGISARHADEFALASHQKALAAQAAGRFDEEIVPVPVTFTSPGCEIEAAEDGNRVQGRRRPARRHIAGSAGEAEAGLSRQGHGDGRQLSQTSDGAAAAVVMSAERAKALGIKPLARFVAFAYAGCLPEEMGIGPVYAIPEGAEAGRPDARPDRPDRAERGLRGAVAGRDQGARASTRRR